MCYLFIVLESNVSAFISINSQNVYRMRSSSDGTYTFLFTKILSTIFLLFTFQASALNLKFEGLPVDKIVFGFRWCSLLVSHQWLFILESWGLLCCANNFCWARNIFSGGRCVLCKQPSWEINAGRTEKFLSPRHGRRVPSRCEADRKCCCITRHCGSFRRTSWYTFRLWVCHW